MEANCLRPMKVTARSWQGTVSGEQGESFPGLGPLSLRKWFAKMVPILLTTEAVCFSSP